MHRALRCSSFLLALLAVGCSDGENQPTTFGSNTNVTGATNPATSVGETTTEPTTGPGATTQDATTMAVDPTTGPGVTTGPELTTGPGTTTTPDQTTGPDDTTTTPDQTTGDSTTGDGTTSDGTTDDSTTTGAQPGKDPQPASGLYADCSEGQACSAQTDGCFQLNDENMAVIDGYCTILCTTVADCGAKPNGPATQECLDIGGGQKVCALKCDGVADCPTGMTCEGVQLPNMQNGNYCW